MGSDQFNLEFERSRKNHLKASLKYGKFNLFFEVNTPERDCNISTALERVRPLVNIVQNLEGIDCGLAITDQKKYRNCYNVVDFASELKLESKNDHLIFISGRGREKSQFIETVEAAVSFGFSNIVSVTGEYLSEENLVNTKHLKFYDSINQLRYLKENFSEEMIFQGAVVNPFKYTPASLYPQLYKLVKKINMGANYIVTQTGWDLLKLQELRWYLEKRNIFIPLIARHYLLKPDYVENIISGQIPGVCISPDFLGILKKELRFGITQFMAAQWRKLQLLTAGANLLGYSGVIIAGIENDKEVLFCSEKIKEALAEFSNYEDWKQAYLEYLSRAEMAPYPYLFYIYSNLLKERYSDCSRENSVSIESVNRMEKINHSISKLMWARKCRLGKKSITRGLIYPCKVCNISNCLLGEMFWVCYRSCPKKLYNGTCGGTKPNGSCEIRDIECIFSKVFRVSHWKKSIDLLEEKIFNIDD